MPLFSFRASPGRGTARRDTLARSRHAFPTQVQEFVSKMTRYERKNFHEVFRCPPMADQEERDKFHLGARGTGLAHAPFVCAWQPPCPTPHRLSFAQPLTCWTGFWLWIRRNACRRVTRCRIPLWPSGTTPPTVYVRAGRVVLPSLPLPCGPGSRPFLLCRAVQAEFPAPEPFVNEFEDQQLSEDSWRRESGHKRRGWHGAGVAWLCVCVVSASRQTGFWFRSFFAAHRGLHSLRA